MSVPRTTAERRHCSRFDIADPRLSRVDIQLAGSVHQCGSQRSGIVLNIAESGIAVIPFRRFAANAGPNLELHLSQVLQPVTSSVVWTGSDGRVGLCFVDPRGEACAQIRHWLTLASPEPSTVRLACRPIPAASYKPVGLEPSLPVIADRVRKLTGASGVAVALGTQNGMECRVVSGDAPAVGTRLRPDEGLSGYSMRTGTIVHSDDLRLDSRVNPAKTATSEIRSVMIVPLVAYGEIAGLLAAFSFRPNAFHDQDLLQAVYFSDLINCAIEEYRVEVGHFEKLALRPISDIVQPSPPAVLFADHSDTPPAADSVVENRKSPLAVSLVKPSPASLAPHTTYKSCKPAKGIRLGMAIPLIACLSAAIIWLVARGHVPNDQINVQSQSPQKNAPLRSQDQVQKKGSVGSSPMLGSARPVIQQKTQAADSPTRVTASAAREPAEQDGEVKLRDSGSAADDNVPLEADKLAVQSNGAIIPPAVTDEVAQTPTPVPALPDKNPPTPDVSAVAKSDSKLPNPTAALVSPPDFVPDRTLSGHSSWVTSIVFSADGQRLVSGSWDRSVKFWDVSSGHEVSTVDDGAKRIEALAFSRDGRWVAGENADNDVTLWNAASGQQVRTLRGRHGSGDLRNAWVYSIAFSPDGRCLASGVDDKTVRLWNVETGSRIRDLVSDPRSVTYIAFSPDGHWLASGADLKSIGVWNVATGHLEKTLEGHSKDVLAVAFSPDGRLIASAAADKTVRLWNLATGKEVRILAGHRSRVTCVAFSADGRWLASGSWDDTIRIWDVESGRQLKTLSGNTEHIYTIAFDSHDHWLASGSEDGSIRLWRLVTPDVARNNVPSAKKND
jgi:WD40 repeat protein